MRNPIAVAGVLLLASWALAADVPKVGLPVVKKEDYKPVVGKFGGRIVQDTPSDPKSFNPITVAETTTRIFTDRIFQGLTRTDAFTGETMPLLAEKWEVAEDGRTWTFHLRKDVQFNNGTPFTAKDVVFTWNQAIYDLSRPADAKDARWPCSMRDLCTFDGKIVKVDAVDDYTVRFVTPVKVAIWDQLMSEPIVSSAKCGPWVADGSLGSHMDAKATSEDLVGTGPFMLEKYDIGEKVVLKRNPHYWKTDANNQHLPYLDQEVVLIVHDTNVMLLNFQQKITDVYQLMSGKDVPLLKPKQKDDNFTLYQLGPDNTTFFVAFNMNLDSARDGKIDARKVNWFRDRRFRQAISYAIDRDALVDNVLQSLGYPQAAPFTRGLGPFIQEGYEPYECDPDKAMALLGEMGLKVKDGVLQDDQGNKVSFTINTNSNNAIRMQAAEFIRHDLEKIGIKVNVLGLEFNNLVEKLNRTFDWECVVMSFTGTLDPHGGANVWKSDGRMHMWWPNQKTPSFDWEKKIDEVFLAGIQEMDKTKRKELYHQWVEIAYKEQPMVYLTATERVWALRNKFGNIFPSPIGGVLHNEDEIFLNSN